jgi:integrase
VGEADVTSAAGQVVAALVAVGRSGETIRRYRMVLDRFAVFVAGRGLAAVSEQVCLDFLAEQTGVRLMSLSDPVVGEKAVQAVRRPLVLVTDALAGRPVEAGRLVVPPHDGCPARFRAVRDEYLVSCRARGNAEATVATKDRTASGFLAYLDGEGAPGLSGLGVRELSGFFVHQRHLRRKTLASMRSLLGDFLDFAAAAGQAPKGLSDRLPPQRHVRNQSEPHLWTAGEIRRVLAAIDRQSAAGKRDYAMILTVARLGLRISDLRHLELGDLDWRAKTITFIQHKTGGPLSLPLLDDVGWAIIDYIRHGRPETACPKVFVKHRYPFDTFGTAGSVGDRLAYHAARAGIEFAPGKACGMHSLRGALAVAMIGNDTPMPVVSAVLGHASTDTTQAYYLRFDTERLRHCALDAEDVLDAARPGERHG